MYMSDDEDEMFNDWGDNEMWDNDDMLNDMDDVQIDMDAVSESVDRKIKYHQACILGLASGNSLMLEAELYLAAHDYSAALVCAIASDRLNGKETLSRKAISMICLYQLGNRRQALEIMEQYQDEVISSKEVSVGLRKKFESTCEVLQFMPQLLDMISKIKR